MAAGSTGEIQSSTLSAVIPIQTSSADQHNLLDVERSSELPVEESQNDERGPYRRLAELALRALVPFCSLMLVPKTATDKLFPWERSEAKLAKYDDFDAAADDTATGSRQPSPPPPFQKMEHEANKRKQQRMLVMNEVRRLLVYFAVLLIVSVCIPKLRNIYIFNLAVLWEWALFGILIVGGYIFAQYFTTFLVLWLKFYYKDGKYALYYIYGVRKPFEFVVFSGLVLLTNAIFFANEDLNHFLNKKTQYKGIPVSTIFSKYVVQTSLTVFIASLLWLLKSILLQSVEASQIYKRLDERIEEEGASLYYITIMNNFYWWTGRLDPQRQRHRYRYGDHRQFYSDKSLYKIWKRADCFIRFTNYTKSREEADTSDLLEKCKRRMGIQSSKETIDQSHLQLLAPDSIMSKNHTKIFYEMLKNSTTSEVVTFETFQSWLGVAYRRCQQLGYTLVDCKESVHQLNLILIAVIVITATLWWLLMTGNGSTKVLVIIAYPFTTGLFMFQDTGKSIFEGVVFTFVKHPFEVGDICIIDNIQLEVKRLGITTTVFQKVGGMEIIMPNADLAQKNISNLKMIPNMTDELEISLDLSTSESKVQQLREKIERHLKENGMNTNGEHVIVKEMKESIKVMLQFRLADNTYAKSLAEHLDKKDKQRSKLLLDIKRFLDELDIKLFPSKNDI